MYRLILLFLFAAAFTTASAQFYRKADFYPRVSPVPQKVFEHFDKRIYAGCVEGNCKDGSGTWLELIAEGYGKSVTDPMYLRKANLLYRITKGVFMEEGRICKGEQTFTYVPLERAGQSDPFLPVNKAQSLDSTNSDKIKGEFTRTDEGFYTDEEVTLSGMAQRFGYKKVKVITRDEIIYYASVEYGNSDSVLSFSGLVDEKLRPVYGLAFLRDGTVFNGYFTGNQPGPGYWFKNKEAVKGEPRNGVEELDFLPDLRLLRTLVSQKRPLRNFELRMGWGSKEQEKAAGFPELDLSRDLVRFSDGWLMGEDGLPKQRDYTGKGIYFYNSRQFYFGSFTKGLPDGKGCFYRRHIGGLWVDISQSPYYVKSGTYTQGIFTEGHFVCKAPGAYNSRKLILKAIEEPGFPELAKMANLRDANALMELGDKYLNGTGVKADFSKAIQYYQLALLFGNIRAAQQLAALYLNGHPALPVEKDIQKATDYYLKGAQLTASALASAEAISDCRKKYFLLKYPFLKESDASRFTLDDEYNLISDLSMQVAVMREKEKKKEAEIASTKASYYPEDALQQMIGKMFFLRSSKQISKTNWKNYFMFYKIMSLEGDNFKVISSSTLDVSIKNLSFPVYWFMDADRNGLVPLKHQYTTCKDCNGTGMVAEKETYKHTSDYEYTLGVKITTTSTRTVATECRCCLGAGFCPVGGKAAEWRY